MTLRPLLWLTERLDDALRITDFYIERTVGGLLYRAFGISRHTSHIIAVPVLWFAMLASPSVWRLIAAIVGRSSAQLPESLRCIALAYQKIFGVDPKIPASGFIHNIVEP